MSEDYRSSPLGDCLDETSVEDLRTLVSQMSESKPEARSDEKSGTKLEGKSQEGADLEAVRSATGEQVTNLMALDRGSLVAMIEVMVKRRPGLALEVRARLDKIRKTPEQLELFLKLEAQYLDMKTTLERYKISTKGMPSWEQIKNGLTSEVLSKALKLTEPTLLLVPPTSLRSKIKAINKHPVDGQKNDVYAYDLKNNDLWNGGKSKTESKWRVKILEGVQDVVLDEDIYDGERTNFEMSKFWVEKYKKEGLDVLNDADVYLTLVMKGLVEGKPVDTKTYTVLNGKNLMASSSSISCGYLSDGRIYLAEVSPGLVSSYFRLRGSIDVVV